MEKIKITVIKIYVAVKQFPNYSHLQDVLSAMKALGLNPAEQDTIDMTNEVGSNGRVYFPDFCKIVLRKYREDDKELLNQNLFKVIYTEFCMFIKRTFPSGNLWH